MKKTAVDREISISLLWMFFLPNSVKLDSRIPFPKLLPWKNTLVLIYTLACCFGFWLQTFAKPISAFKPSHGSSQTIKPYAHIQIFYRTVSDMLGLRRRLKYSLILLCLHSTVSKSLQPTTSLFYKFGIQAVLTLKMAYHCQHQIISISYQCPLTHT